MAESGRPPAVRRFGIFELDLRAGELRRQGLRIRLQDQPFRVLTTLLERPGEVVTREELCKRLWPDGTVVGFDHSLASAVNRLREALGDSGDSPRYIETLPRHGYRFIGPVDRVVDAGAAGRGTIPEAAPPRRVAGRILRLLRTKVAAGVGFLVLAVLALVFLARPDPPPRPLGVVQLTVGGWPATSSVLAGDGLRIYFSRNDAGRWSLAAVPASGGEPMPISTSVQSPFLEDISPDGTELLVSDRPEFRREYPLFVVPAVGGSARRVGNVEAHCAGWFPQGPKVLYTYGHDICLANRDGSEKSRIVATSRIPWWPRASPDGSLIRFSQWDRETNSNTLWQVAADGTGLRPLLPGWNVHPSECCGHWSEDGRYFVFRSTREGLTSTWVMPGGIGFPRRAGFAPVRLTEGPLATFAPLPSRDRRRVFVIGNQERAEVVKYDATARQFVPFLPGSSVAMLDITSDGGSLSFVSYPDGSLWRSKRDLTGRSQLTSPPLNVMLPRWSPDGRLVAFQARMPEGRWQIYLVPAQGGSPQPILPEMRAGQTDPGWSPDGKQLVFGGPEDEATGLRLVDLRSRQVSTLPASEGLFSPRWSPGGQYIAALRLESHDLMVFNLRTQTWVELAKGPAGWPCWSRDGQHLYVLGSREGGDWIDRVRISDHKAERVVSLAGIQRPSGVVGSWIGLAPDDSLLVLRDLSIREIYAVSLEAP